VQILLNYFLTTFACYPRDHPLPRSLVPHLPVILAAANLIALWGVAGVICAWLSWARTKEGLGHHRSALEEGRTRFLGLSGIWLSLIFSIVVFFTGIVLLLVSPCAFF
jgi:hypothetical protein